MLIVRTPRESITDEDIKIKFTDWELLDDSNVTKLEMSPGIYEIAAYNAEIDCRVVGYVGMTSKLQERLNTHYFGKFKNEHGKELMSNISSQISHAINKGWVIKFRTFKTKDDEIAGAMERVLLDLYNYPWNQLYNDSLRTVNYDAIERDYWKHKAEELEVYMKKVFEQFLDDMKSSFLLLLTKTLKRKLPTKK